MKPPHKPKKSRRQRPEPPLEGTIRAMHHNRMSGIAMLVLRDEHGELLPIPCDYRMTCEALLACFGEVSVIGKRIWYRCDAVGVLETIGPVSKKRKKARAA